MFYFVLITSTAWLFSSLASHQTNTLFKNANWKSSKVTLYKGVVGAVAFFTTRTALAEEKLNLGAWHGYNEIILASLFLPKVVTFETELSPKSDLTFIFDRNETGYKGLRVSANLDFENEYVEVDRIGNILKRAQFLRGEIKATANKVSIQFRDKNIVFSLNNIVIGNVENTVKIKNEIGFKSQSGRTTIDNFYVKDLDGAEFKESFENKSKYQLFFLTLFALAVIAIAALALGKSSSKHELIMGMVLVNIFTIVLLAYSADYFYFSKLYPTEASKFEKLIHSVDASRFRNNIEPEDRIVSRALQRIRGAPKGSYNFVLMGSSQTWGAGALTNDHQLESYLSDGLSLILKTKKVTVINAAVSGATVDTMLNQLIKLNAYPIKHVILIASNNDSNTESFQENVIQVLNYCKNKSIKLTLVQEANYFDEININLPKNHSTLKKIATENSLTIINSHEYLREKRNEGYFWWDNVHLTSAGQKLTATVILNNLKLH